MDNFYYKFVNFIKRGKEIYVCCVGVVKWNNDKLEFLFM